MKSVRPDTPRTVEVVKVIRVVTGRGRGIDQGDPFRTVTQYWSFEGALLGEDDSCEVADEVGRKP